MGIYEKLAKMTKKFDGSEPAPLSAEDKIKGRKAAKQAKREEKRDKKEVKNLAAKSMDVSNWTNAVLSGADARFSGRVEENVDDKLAAATVGLVTYDQLKAQKELLVNGKEIAAEEAKRKAEEKEVTDRKAKKQKAAKSKATLSFDQEDDDE
mmetsp:Transcript_48826/g.116237  ORF Transcript_48826/g.116237 Transcript_48826/m.116237 type:complete len:152 (-) Transcript_48826:128-583(-)